jgi:invasion protein IalB
MNAASYRLRSLRALASTALLVATTNTQSPAQTTGQVSPAAYTISGWRLECATQNSVLSCQVLNQVLARSNSAVIAAISVQQGAAKTPVLVVQVPLGVAIDQPVKVAIQNGATQMLPFFSCYGNGCFARAPLDDALLTAMRTSKQPLSLTYANLDSALNKQSINVTLALDGFSQAYDKLK